MLPVICGPINRFIYWIIFDPRYVLVSQQITKYRHSIIKPLLALFKSYKQRHPVMEVREMSTGRPSNNRARKQYIVIVLPTIPKPCHDQRFVFTRPDKIRLFATAFTAPLIITNAWYQASLGRFKRMAKSGFIRYAFRSCVECGVFARWLSGPRWHHAPTHRPTALGIKDWDRLAWRDVISQLDVWPIGQQFGPAVHRAQMIRIPSTHFTILPYRKREAANGCCYTRLPPSATELAVTSGQGPSRSIEPLEPITI